MQADNKTSPDITCCRSKQLLLCDHIAGRRSVTVGIWRPYWWAIGDEIEDVAIYVWEICRHKLLEVFRLRSRRAIQLEELKRRRARSDCILVSLNSRVSLSSVTVPKIARRPVRSLTEMSGLANHSSINSSCHRSSTRLDNVMFVLIPLYSLL